MIECKVVTTTSKLVPIFYKGNHLMQQTKPKPNKDWSCVAMDYPIISFTSNSPMVHGDPSVIQKINNQSKSIHTIMGQPQIITNLLL
jgi:hypothetical protein